MTKQDLIMWLIAHYSYCLDKIDKLSYAKALRFLDKEDAIVGVCLVAVKQLGISLRFEGWVNKYEPPGPYWKQEYWTTPPGRCYNINEIKETLKYRLKILNKELLNP